MVFILYQGRCLLRYIWFAFFFIWHLYCIQLHLIHCIGIWSYVANLYSDHAGTISFIGHNDVASYLVGYEGKRHGIALHLYCDFGMCGVCLGVWLWEILVRSDPYLRIGGG